MNSLQLFLKSNSNSKKSSLLLVQWNCNYVLNKIPLLKDYLERLKPDVMLLNEIKLEKGTANFHLDFPGYICISKERNSRGGGVAVLVRRELDFVEDRSFDSLGMEIVAIKLKLSNRSISIIGLYNPPKDELKTELFRILGGCG